MLVEMPNFILDCGILVMASLYEPGLPHRHPEHGKPDPTGLLRPTIGELVSGRVTLDIHVPELIGAPPCIYTWRVTRLERADRMEVVSTVRRGSARGTDITRVSALLEPIPPSRAHDDLSVLVLPTRPTPRRIAAIAEIAGTDANAAERILAAAPVRIRSRLTLHATASILKKLHRVRLKIGRAHIPRHISGEDVEFDLSWSWDHLDSERRDFLRPEE
jgi:hypothetical protein